MFVIFFIFCSLYLSDYFDSKSINIYNVSLSNQILTCENYKNVAYQATTNNNIKLLFLWNSQRVCRRFIYERVNIIFQL